MTHNVAHVRSNSTCGKHLPQLDKKKTAAYHNMPFLLQIPGRPKLTERMNMIRVCGEQQQQKKETNYNNNKLSRVIKIKTSLENLQPH